MNLNLKLDVLEALNTIGAMGMPTKTLVNQVQLVARPAPTFSEVEATLRELEALQHVVSLRDELDTKIVIWVISSSGQLQLRMRGR